MILSNIHTHTCFSDGRNSAREMVEAALARGFVSLGFSDHGFAPHDSAGMSLENERLYREEIGRLKKEYAGRIEIALGYEHDWSMPEADYGLYDYVIESVHFFGGEEKKSIDHSAELLKQVMDELYGSDAYRMCRDYFRSVCASVEGTKAEVIGHIELVRKFNEKMPLFDAADERYLAGAQEVVRLAAEKGKIVEINTGAMSRGYRSEPYPDSTLLKELHKLGGRIAISSDCHRAEWIAYGFDQACALAKAAGFKENWIWRAGHFTPTPL